MHLDSLFLSCLVLLLGFSLGSEAAFARSPGFTEASASRFARLALDCIHKEYPNKIAHVMESDRDAKPPRELTPAFYGCFDWHSAVHGHWLLVRLLRTFESPSFEEEARGALSRNLNERNIRAELSYINGAGRKSFERPYGLAWLLQLSAELAEWDDPQAKVWGEALLPLEIEVASRFRKWLPKLSHPARTGEHSQTAFALGLVFDWALVREDKKMAQLIEERARTYYGADRGWNLSFEPGGQDFLSPGLAEADLMRRILPSKEYGAWLSDFLPELDGERGSSFLAPAVVTDKADGKLAHLDGLNLSRAWMLEGMVAGLPDGDSRVAVLKESVVIHKKAGLLAVTGEHYAGGHWLGSFAVYLVSKRGINRP